MELKNIKLKFLILFIFLFVFACTPSSSENKVNKTQKTVGDYNDMFLSYTEKINDYLYTFKATNQAKTNHLYVVGSVKELKIEIKSPLKLNTNSITWQGVDYISKNNDSVYFIISNVQNKSKERLISMSYQKNEQEIITRNMKVYFVSIEKVEEDPNQKYGYDDFSMVTY